MSSQERQRREERLRRIVDDVLTGRDLHGLEPRAARDLQLAASAINHDRFRRLLSGLTDLLAQASEEEGDSSDR